MTMMKTNDEQSRGMSASTLPGGKDFDVRNYLHDIRHSYLRSQVLCERAEQYREMATRATGRADAIRTSGTSRRSKVETYVLAMADAHAELQREIHGLVKETRRAERLIAQLPDQRHHAVLQYRYLCGLTWDEIAEKLHFTLRWVHKLHGEAIEQLERICQNNRTL